MMHHGVYIGVFRMIVKEMKAVLKPSLRGTVRKSTPRTQRRYPALFSGRVPDERVEAGLVAGGERAALESLKCG